MNLGSTGHTLLACFKLAEDHRQGVHTMRRQLINEQTQTHRAHTGTASSSSSYELQLQAHALHQKTK